MPRRPQFALIAFAAIVTTLLGACDKSLPATATPTGSAAAQAPT